MELRQLRYFVEVGRALNFTRAAAKLRVAQPSLSRQIRDLEHELGVKLLERDQRHVALTASGRAFLEEAEHLLRQSEQAAEVARSEGQRTERLSIAYVWGLFHTLAPTLLQRFRRAHPEAGVHLLDMNATEQARALRSGTIHAGFIGFAEEAEGAGLPKVRVGSSRFMAVLPKGHAQAKRKRIDLKSLERDFFVGIAQEAFPGAYHEMLAACERAGFKPRVAQTVERGHTLLALVASGCGVSVLPEALEALPHQGVVFREMEQGTEGDLFLAYAPKKKSALLEAFVRSCAEPVVKSDPAHDG